MNWDYYHILSMIRNHLQKYCDESDQEDTIGVAGVGEEICWKNQVIIKSLRWLTLIKWIWECRYKPTKHFIENANSVQMIYLEHNWECKYWPIPYLGVQILTNGLFDHANDMRIQVLTNNIFGSANFSKNCRTNFRHLFETFHGPHPDFITSYWMTAARQIIRNF